jgi:hypothetical protein
MYINNLLLDQMRCAWYQAVAKEEELDGVPDVRIFLKPVNNYDGEEVTIGWKNKMGIKDAFKYADALNNVYYNKGFK